MEERVPTASLRRKNKGKAPRPPADTRSIESSSTLEFDAAIMEQKENLERDIQLTVVLPDEVTASASVNGSKPMMDLLIFLCAQYRLNPSAYTMELVSDGPNPVKFKPNTPVGMLEVDKVILKPKNVDDKQKKPAPVVPEQTVRVVINYKKTQKAVVRASPHVSLQELLPTISTKCELDPLHTVLLRDLQSQEPLEMSKSLNDLGLRELYAADTSRAASAAELHSSSSQESFQIPQSADLQKPKDDEKGFFRFLRRSKKKREQASSAPATPLLADQRSLNMARPSKVFKQYESNTLPSEMPKKRRAPLPPMYASQTVPKDFPQGGPRPQSCVLKSVSVDGDQQDLSGRGVVRTSSLQMSGSSSNDSTLRRGKRKAPPPPSPTSPPGQDRTDENSSETAKSSPTRSTSEDEHFDLSPATAVFDYSLEGIEEKEENSSFHKEAGEAAAASAEPSIPTPPVDVATAKDMVVSMSPGVDSGGSKLAEEEMPEALRAEPRVTNSTAVGTDTGDLLPEKNKPLQTLDLNSHLGKFENQNSPHKHSEHKNQAGTVESNSVRVTEGARSTDGTVHEHEDCKSNPLHGTNGKNHFNSTCKTVVELVMVKKHDAAIQTASLQNDETYYKMDAEDLRFRDVDKINNPHWTVPNRLPLQSPRVQQPGNLANNSTSRSQETTIMKENRSTDTSNGFFPTETSNPGLVHSPSKGYALYRQFSEPKPKPSNEITRDYIPKVGMTTYKIVPPSSLEKLRFLEPEKWMDGKDMGHDAPMHYGELYRNQTDTNSAPVDLKKDHHNYYGYSSDAHVVSTSAYSTSTSTSQTQTNKITSNGPPLVMPKPDKNRIPSEKRETPSDFFPKARTNSFYSQLQRRVTGQYVTSAAAKSVISPVSPYTNPSPPSLISPYTNPTPPSLTSPNTNPSPPSLTSPNIPIYIPAHISPPSHDAYASHTMPSSPIALASTSALTSTTAFTSHTFTTSPAALSPAKPTSLSTLTRPTALTSPTSSTAVTSLTSPTSLTSTTKPTSLSTLTRPTALTIPTSSTAVTSLTSPTSLTSTTKPTSPSTLTRPTSLTSPTSPTAITSPTSPTALTSTTKPTSPFTLTKPTALSSPTRHTALPSPTIPIPAKPVQLVNENNVPSFSPLNSVPSTHRILPSSALIQTKSISYPGDGKSEKLTMKPPLIAPKPFSARSKTSGSLQLRSFAAPRPSSVADNPSPFALAVSSAVRRSQSFSKGQSASRHLLRGVSLNERSTPTSPDDFQPTSPESYLRRSSDCTLEKNMNLTNSEKSSTVQFPPLVLDKKPPVSCPSADPEQIHQSLLQAIGSGEAAANLKRVTVRSNTISINGRSGWSHAVSTDVP